MSLSNCVRGASFAAATRFNRKPRAGLTLLELIVTLGILAALATMAVRSIEPLADQSRYEQTLRVLNELRDASIGVSQTHHSYGTPLVSGYIADTGRLPTTLDDLMTNPAGIAAFSAQSFDSDRDTVADVSLSSGWNGPYVLLGPGATQIVDGWNRNILVDPDAGEFDYRSLGSDGDSIAPETDYRADLSVTMPATRYVASSTTFRLFAIDGTTGTRIDPNATGTEQLGVLFYGINANGGTTGVIEEVTLPVANSGTFEVSLSNLRHGRAAARGFQWDDTDADDVLDAGETIVLSSYTVYFTIVGGSDQRLELELR